MEKSLQERYVTSYKKQIFGFGKMFNVFERRALLLISKTVIS